MRAGRYAIAIVSGLGAVGIYAVAVSFESLGDAPLLLLAVPLGLTAIVCGVRGGIAMGVLASVLAAAWWIERDQPAGLAWLACGVTASLLVGVVIGWIADSRQALARTIAHHREHSLDLIATASYEGYFTEVNPAFTRTLGFTAEQLMAEPFLSFVHPDDVDRTLDAVARQTDLGHDVLSFRNRYRTKDGSYRWLEWTSRPDPDGHTLIAVARDVTDRQQLEELEHEYQHRLEEEVRERTAELEGARREILLLLARVAEYRDDETFAHTERIRHSAASIAAELGLSSDQVEVIREAAPLHDIGKLGVPDAVLRKPGRLSHEEREQMLTHAAAGASILEGSSSRVLQTAEEICRSHHEWWDGSGYPDGLRGEEIPVAARIVALADVFDALTHARPYKEAWSVEDALAEVRRLRNVQFDPLVVDAFERLDAFDLADAAGRAAGREHEGSRAA
ncbi:MAG TPA: HD domain-containing phosphohydrolase [Gaiellaceae bacterium]|nr:HD domain-containing phosphohydrolase [Gaiellaceae bacterium]